MLRGESERWSLFASSATPSKVIITSSVTGKVCVGITPPGLEKPGLEPGSGVVVQQLVKPAQGTGRW